MPEEIEVMEAEGVTRQREERMENGTFKCPSFIRNPLVLAQILLYGYLFYTRLPGVDEVGALLVWLLLLLPMCVLNLIGTHMLKKLFDKRKLQKQD